MFQECLEGDPHVLVFVLLAQLVAKITDAVLLESLIHSLLEDTRGTQHLVCVRGRCLLPVQLGLLDDVLADHVDSLVVLHKHVAFVRLMSGSHHDKLLAEFLNFKCLDLLIVFLAARLRDGVTHTSRGTLGVWVYSAGATRMVVLRQLAHVSTCDVCWIVI